MDLIVIDCGHACLSVFMQADRLDKLQSEFRTQEQKLEDIDTARRKVAVSETLPGWVQLSVQAVQCLPTQCLGLFSVCQGWDERLVVAQFFPVGTKATECVAIRN